VFFRYGIRNAILPALTALALGMAGLIGGSMLVEYILPTRAPATPFTGPLSLRITQ
jgi:hypothetical protein